MNNLPKKDPRTRMRSLTGNTSPLTRLPKKTDASSAPFLPDQGSDQPTDHAHENASAQTPPKPARASRFKGFKLKGTAVKNLKFAAPFWTIASIFSMVVNIILLVALVLVLNTYKNIRIENVTNIGEGLLGGLYTNFEKMDRAHIISNIPVQSEIPVKFDLLLNQQTNVVLSEDVTIRNALVTVNTGGMNITRANATIVLPAGTGLPVVLNLTVPVDTKVPVVLNVPVDIPLKDTQLHEPFAGLQEVVKPFYCMIDPSVLNLDGQPICQ